jgi:hypothetical protein
MLTEQETNDMHAMITEFESASSGASWFKLKRLAETTGDEWERLMREYLSEWRALRR